MKRTAAGDPLHARALDDLQRRAFEYFVHEANPANGLVRDKTAPDSPASIAAVGMALTCYPIGVERGFIARDDAVARTATTLRFLANSEQGTAPDATGHKGFYYHFLDMDRGRRARRCELSSIDTALLIAGVLVAGRYFDRATAPEGEIRALATRLHERVDWAWMLGRSDTVCHGWKPESGFLRHRWQGYSEGLILMLLALGSPTHPIPARCYEAWCSTYRWRTVEGIAYLHAGPLFIHQMSHAWCDLRGVRDRFMREHESDYFENSRRATLIQQRYAIANPNGFTRYGKHVWGLTASDGPGGTRRTIDGVKRRFFDYVARGVPDGPDDGTVAPWVAAASLPFAPEIVAPTVTHFASLPIETTNSYGFQASFNCTFDAAADNGVGWISRYHFGINVGPIVVMIENHRSGLVWRLMRDCDVLRTGFERAGFTGGWLAQSTARA